MSELDVTMSGGGSVVSFLLHTDAARAWVNDNLALESWQWMGGAVVVEARYAADIAEGMLADGLVLA